MEKEKKRIQRMISLKEKELQVLIANGFFFKAYNTMQHVGRLYSILKQHEMSAKYHYLAARLRRAVNLDIVLFLGELEKR
ncbi:MAG: hypothetical protein ACFFCS_03005 [Candidatus Hodarchaeota archaeon]